MFTSPAAARHALENHPHAEDCRRLVHHAMRLDLQRAGLETHDLPFAVVLFASNETRVLEAGADGPETGLIERLEARIWSVRSLLRACARCSHVDLSFESAHTLSALRVQVEHAAGPPLDVYLPLDDDHGWWVEGGAPWVFAPVAE
jgi:hypothetical protein